MPQKEEFQQAKNLRADHLKTPRGRAAAWIQGLQDHVTRAEREARICNGAGDETCHLPANLAKEYAASWTSKAQGMKRLRPPIDKTIAGDEIPDNFAEKIASAEKVVLDFKKDMQRYKTLNRGYAKDKDKA